MINSVGEKPVVSVVVATYNGGAQLYHCVKSISRCRGPKFEIIIADDGSSNDQTRQVVERLRAEVPQRIVHAFQEKAGFRLARSRNNAVRFSQGSILLFIDHDIIVPTTFLQGVVKTMTRGWYLGGRRVKLDADTSNEILNGSRHPDSLFTYRFGFYARVRRFPGWRYLFPLLNRGPGRTSQSWRGMAGFCLVVERDAFNRVDGFDGIYREYGAEDWDFLARLSNAGLQGAYLPRSCTVAHLWHNEKPVDLDSINYRLLEQTIATRKVRAVEGFSTLGEFSPSAVTG